MWEWLKRHVVNPIERLVLAGYDIEPKPKKPIKKVRVYKIGNKRYTIKKRLRSSRLGKKK